MISAKGDRAYTLHATVRCIRTLLEEDHHLIITDMWPEMTGWFSHETGEATIVYAL